MWTRVQLAGALAVFGLLVAFVGCGNDLVVGGMIPITPTAAATETPTCVASGEGCSVSSDCCSGICFSPDGFSLICQ